MVFYGFQIPAKNLNKRNENLKLEIQNKKLEILNASLRIKELDEIKLNNKLNELLNNGSKTSLDLASKSSSSVLNLDEETKKLLDEKAFSELDKMRGADNTAIVSDISAPSNLSGLNRAQKSAIIKARSEARSENRILTKEEEQEIIDKYEKISGVISQISGDSRSKLKKNVEKTEESEEVLIPLFEESEEESKEESKEDEEEDKSKFFEDSNIKFNSDSKLSFEDIRDKILSKKPSNIRYGDMLNVLNSNAETQLKKSFLNKINHENKLEVIKKIIKSNNNSLNANISILGKAKYENLYVSGDEIYFMVNNNPRTIPKNSANAILLSVIGDEDKKKVPTPKTSDIDGAGLKKNKVKNKYYDYKRNFGNLSLSEESLKKNNLTIYNPSRQRHIISLHNISPLLKKMILDIRDTLEFDLNDYHNLTDDEEKKTIEKIIRFQKDMKEYNINKLIDDDDRKIKKRLEILTAQLNAGNNSKIVKDEMIRLLKTLERNNAISHSKYLIMVNTLKKM